MKGILVALGGNAIVQPGEEGTLTQQYANTSRAMEEIADLIEDFRGPLLITHGNGPQVGNILLRSELGRDRVYPISLDVCVSDSEGGMGYMIQQVLHNVLARRGTIREVVTLVTQTVVDRNDPAFSNPSKFIGSAVTEEVAERLRERGVTIKMDKGRGWRRVVPSPDPIQIVEEGIVARLLDDGVIVIAAGGGGIPVTRGEKGTYEGIEAVVDKDLASVLFASETTLDTFVILTGSQCVSLYFNTPNEKRLVKITIAQACEYMAEGHFPAGSMGPKIEAAIRFIRAGGERVIITSPGNLKAALAGKAGTTIVK